MKRHNTMGFEAEEFGLWRPNIKHESTNNVYEARAQMLGQLRQLYDLRDTLQADATRTPESKALAVRNAAKRVKERIFETNAAAQVSTLKTFGEIQTKFDKARSPRSAAEETRRHNIRQSLAAMNSTERMDTVRYALIEKDAATIDAIASGKIFESRVISLHFNEAQAAFDELTAPDDAALRTELRDGLQILEAFQRQADSILDREFIRPGDATADAATAATAALQAVGVE